MEIGTILSILLHYLCSTLSQVKLNSSLGVDWIPLVGINSNTEETRVGL